MTAHLRRRGHQVNHKRVQRLMRLMGLQAIYPRRRTSVAATGHKVYPYLLRNLAITRPNQVWSTDITYIPMLHGFMYLVAIMDWYSRYVVTWQLSNTLDGHFCLEALDRALAQARPEIFNTARGAHQHGWPWAGAGQRVRRAALALGQVRTRLPVREYALVPELEKGLHDYFTFYNHERPHQSLSYQTPAEVHFASADR